MVWFPMLILEKITASMVLDTDKQNTVKAIFMKQFMASAYLFWEMFAMTGPLAEFYWV